MPKFKLGVGASCANLCVGNLVKLALSLPFLATTFLTVVCGGCALCPEKYRREKIHNPFPQIKRVAVLPFYNQSDEPTINTEMVADEYYAALQAIPGFEVLPVGVAKAQWIQYSRIHGEPTTGQQFQELAQQMEVEALVVGSVTDFDSYYPPRMAMTVHWYAANDGFHPIPNGYGLPWGTDREDQIPSRVVLDTEFDLARSQLSTQTPSPVNLQAGLSNASADTVALVSVERAVADVEIIQNEVHSPSVRGEQTSEFHNDGSSMEGVGPLLPQHWPNPTDLIPDPPSPMRPVSIASHRPILSHTRLYRGDDPYFTNRLANHIESGDDARPVSWQGYLKRSDDFIHFCCHLHIVEMLESRGGREQSDLILRWPLSRY